MLLAPYLQYTLTIWVWWLGHFWLIYGLGLLATRILRVQPENGSHIYAQFWLGLSALFFVLQITHLFFRVDGWILLFLLFCTLIGYSLNLSHFRLRIPQLNRNVVWSITLLILIALWTANRSAGPVANSDTALYHLASMQWNATYPIVKGLGNLHDRFAFNSSYFLYAALTDVGPWNGKSQHIVNGFLLTVLLCQVATYGKDLLTTSRQIKLKSIFALLFLGPIITETLKGNVSSLSPDFPIFVLGIILGCQLLDYLAISATSPTQEKFRLLSIVALSCLGITIKLSFLPLGLFASIIALWYWYMRHRDQKLTQMLRELWRIGLFCIFFLGIWMFRGVLLSGYPIYPMTLGALPVPWRIPRSLVISIDMWIRSWARQPWQPWPDVLQDWQWIHLWFADMPLEMIKVLYVSSAAIVLFGASTFHRRHAWLWPLILPPLAGIMFWFLSAPSFRFAGASFWLLATGLLTLGLFNLFAHNQRWLRSSPMAIAIVICIYIVPWQQPLLIYPTDAQILPTTPTPQTTIVQTQSGLTLRVPLAGHYACWRIIMCTPYFRPTLHAFDPQDVSQGLYLDETFTYADIDQSALPQGVTAPSDLGVAIIDRLIPGQPTADSQSQVRLLIFSATAKTIHAKLQTADMEIARTNKDNQLVLHTSQYTHQLPLNGNTGLQFDIPLQKDFNVVTFELPDGVIALEPRGPSDGPATLSISKLEFSWQ